MCVCKPIILCYCYNYFPQPRDKITQHRMDVPIVFIVHSSHTSPALICCGICSPYPHCYCYYHYHRYYSTVRYRRTTATATTAKIMNKVNLRGQMGARVWTMGENTLRSFFFIFVGWLYVSWENTSSFNMSSGASESLCARYFAQVICAAISVIVGQ